MIARIWRGRVPAFKADDYYEVLLKTGIKDYVRTAGNKGTFVFQEIECDVAHFVTLTLWESVSAIRAFAGPEPEDARYYPEDEEFLLEKEPFVRHMEVRFADWGSVYGKDDPGPLPADPVLGAVP